MTDIQTNKIVTTGGTQSRVELSEAAVAEYAEAMTNGDKLPPIVVFHDGSTYWLADGFHRVMAANRAKIEWLHADVHRGTKRDAILYSVGANATHGLPRTNADKRHAVTLLLQDEEWVTWSTSDIARQCHVSRCLVDAVRASLAEQQVREIPTERKFTTKHGTVSTMRTENIGKRDTGLKMKNGRRLVLSAGRDTQAARTSQIAELAGQGHNAAQIAGAIGIDEGVVRRYAKQGGVTLPDIRGTRRLDSRRVIEQTVLGLESSAASLSAIPVSFDGISSDEAGEWAKVVGEALRTFRHFHKQLTEAANV